MKTIKTNESRMFSKISRYFKEPKDALREAIQNAYRAGWPNPQDNTIRVQYETAGDATNVTISDSGRGIPDFGTMLSPMDSEWADSVEEDQDPAGLGIYALLAYTDSVVFETIHNGEHRLIRVDSKLFLKDQAYRDELYKLEAKTHSSSPSKTTVESHGLRMSVFDVERDTENLLTFFIDTKTFINGEEFEGMRNIRLLWETDEAKIIGYDVNYSSSSHYYYDAGVVWHGMHIKTNGSDITVSAMGEDFKVSVSHAMDVIVREDYARCKVAIVPKKEKLFTFQLPDRHHIVPTEVSERVFNDLLKSRYQRIVDAELEALPKAVHVRTLAAIKSTATRLGIPGNIVQLIKASYQGFIYADYCVDSAEYGGSPQIRRECVEDNSGMYVIGSVYTKDTDGEYVTDGDFDLIFSESGKYVSYCTKFDGSDSNTEVVDLYINFEKKPYSWPENDCDFWLKEGHACYIVKADGTKEDVIGELAFANREIFEFPTKAQVYIEGDYDWLCQAADHWCNRAEAYENDHDADAGNIASLLEDCGKFKAEAADCIHLSDLVDQLVSRIGADCVAHTLRISIDRETSEITLGNGDVLKYM